MNSFLHRTEAIVLIVILFFAMIVMVILGRWITIKWKGEAEPKGGMNSLMSALYALSGLILAFTFSMSENRLEKVRDVMRAEVNDIGTAVLRSNLYSDTVRDSFRADFKNYADAIILYYTNPANAHAVNKSKRDAANAATKLWMRATNESKRPNMLIPSNQMIPALNDMFDIAQAREIVIKSIVPDLIVLMLFVCVLSICFLGGFTSASFRRKDWIIITGFALVSSMVIYTTLDLSRPTRGMIQNEAGEQAIMELQELFN
jgi:hypothetical protein